jgi:hypothetical protein
VHNWSVWGDGCCPASSLCRIRRIKGMRRPIVAGNWKMNKTASEAAVFVEELKPLLDGECAGCDVVLCPPLTSLGAVHASL